MRLTCSVGSFCTAICVCWAAQKCKQVMMTMMMVTMRHGIQSMLFRPEWQAKWHLEVKSFVQVLCMESLLWGVENAVPTVQPLKPRASL